MIKPDITYQEKLNELKLDIRHPNSTGKVFVLVEGESDIRLFRKLFNLQVCKVESIPGGNTKVENCVDLLIKQYPLLIGIRDADFIHLGKSPYKKKHIFLTDYHDIEMIFISENDAFSSLAHEFTYISKSKHNSLRKNIIKSIEFISYLKWLENKSKLHIVFDKSGFQDLLSYSTNQFDFTAYFDRLLSKSPNVRERDINVVIKKINKLRKLKPTAFQLCNGHDFMKAFSSFIKQKGKSKNITDDQIASAFRMIFNLTLFSKTQLYKDTKKWADSKERLIYL